MMTILALVNLTLYLISGQVISLVTTVCCVIVMLLQSYVGGNDES